MLLIWKEFRLMSLVIHLSVLSLAWPYHMPKSGHIWSQNIFSLIDLEFDSSDFNETLWKCSWYEKRRLRQPLAIYQHNEMIVVVTNLLQSICVSLCPFVSSSVWNFLTTNLSLISQHNIEYCYMLQSIHTRNS